MEPVLFEGIPAEPDCEQVDAVRARLREARCQVVVGLGGGSVIDAAKAAAGLHASPFPTREHLVGGRPVPEEGLPWLALPTTAGAGAEATPNAVLTDRRARVKQSLRSWGWLAAAAVVDPELTVACPPPVTARSGMDAFTQAVESYTSRWATPLTEALSFEAALRIARALPAAWADGRDLAAREDMAWGATMAGMALANARLGAVHGLAHAVGMALELPHGEVCAILLPWVMECNLPVVAAKYARLARELGVASPESPDREAARALVDFVQGLQRRLGIRQRLGEAGLEPGMIPRIVEESLSSGSLAANPRALEAADLATILTRNLA